ncbi:MAG: enoyl-CoA hydratase/isomerase family protein [Candidatus Rokubacteria bacterium]|nr:enoyl-CoA hydratase/isomerase family protein [Candidatus Rokubacteria bacterium]
MAYETLIVEREEGFAVVTLNRPPANAISVQLVLDLEAAVAELALDPAVRALILTGAGERIFCGGADLASAFSGGPGEDLEAFLRRGHALLRRIETLPKPVIAAIQGHATGGGCEIAMACHLRVLKETARIGQTESNLGIIPGYGGTLRLPRLIGRTKALEYLILGTQIPAAEALAVGLVNRLAKEGETLNEAKALARAIVKRAPVATRLIIACVDRGLGGTIEQGIDAEVRAFLEVLKTEDAAEGIQAFFAKRPPQFKGA